MPSLSIRSDPCERDEQTTACTLVTWHFADKCPLSFGRCFLHMFSHSRQSNCSVSPCIHLFVATLSKLIFWLLVLPVCPHNTPGGRRGANRTRSLSVPSFLTRCNSFFWALFKHAERHTHCRAEITISHTAETCADSVAPNAHRVR